MASHNNGSPVISVICTARNASQTIDEAILSVQQQTFETWEMIVVDDGSDDDTAECVARAAEKDPRIKLTRTDGVGRARALNLAVSRAQTALIANLDADDCFHPKHLEVMARCQQARPEFAIFCTKTVIFGEGNHPVWLDEANAGSTNCLEITDVAPQLLARNPVCHSSVLVAKETLEAVGGYNETIPSQIDYDLWIRIAAAGGRIGRISVPLVAKRIHMGQSFEARNRLRYLINSARTQARAIRLLGGRWHHWLSLILRFIWGLRPRRLIGSIFKRRTSSGS